MRLKWPARLVCLLIALAGAVASGQPAATGDLIDGVLAFVDGQIIMRSDVRAFSQLGLVEPGDGADDDERVLAALVERQLILAEVDRYVVDEPTTEEVETALGAVIRKAGGPVAFDALLPLVGFNRQDIAQIVRDDLRIDRYLAGRFPSADVRPDLVEEWIASLMARADVLLPESRP